MGSLRLTHPTKLYNDDLRLFAEISINNYQSSISRDCSKSVIINTPLYQEGLGGVLGTGLHTPLIPSF